MITLGVRAIVTWAAAIGLIVEPVAALANESVKPATPAVLTQPTGAPAVDPATGLYVPTDKDERGLWMQFDEAERELKVSPQVIHDARLNDYVRSVFCRTVGQDQCKGVRIYVIRTGDFNASMAPNGMMEVWSGLLVRTRNEAQLAAVLGHEFTHYRNRHSLKLFQDVKSKTSAAAWLSMFVGIIGALLVLPSIFEHSREMEHEADVGGLNLMAAAGYDTREAAKIWEQLRAEMDATALERKTKSRKDKNGGMWATHPPSAERVAYLTETAQKIPGTPGATGADSYSSAMQHYWPQFIDDQLKRNEFGGSEYMIAALEREGPSDWLNYAHGELYRRRAGPGDLEKAVAYYGQGIEAHSTLPDLWRARGLSRLKLGQTDDGRADLKEYLQRAPDAPDKAMIAMMAGG